MKTFFKIFGGGLLLGLAWLAPAAVGAESTNEIKPVIAPPAGWVKPQLHDPRAAALRPEAGEEERWLLFERQMNAATNETFIHCARQILTVEGVQNGSNLKIDFNPVYQALTLHWVRVWRGTNHLDRLAADKLRVVRQERDMEQQILNGEQTAILVMDDVRVGDVVDYAYSVKGENPVFDNRFSGSLRMQLTEPVDHLYARLVWPPQRRFFPKAFGGVLTPQVVAHSNLMECVWDLHRVPAAHLEDQLPVWFDPELWVQVSEFKSWAEVNRWALGLFENHSAPSAELRQKVAEWKGLATPEQQVLAALRFVQDEIRYFGIEIGVSADKPADPSVVLARRYGDCKDKSLLFVTLLRGLGIEAYPVLVNTQARHTIQDWLPAAGIFDHCIAVVRLQGQTWWLDATAGYQRGALADHYLPRYGCGLVVSPQTTGLNVISQNTGLSLTTTTEHFGLGRKQGVSDLRVVTVAQGRDAERLRALFATTKREEIEKTYTRYYAGSYPGITMTASIEVQDNEAGNTFQTVEHYSIDNAWIKSDQDGKYRCDFYPFAIANFTKKPADLQRRLPLAVSYPEHQILRTEITVPAAWSYDKESKSVEDAAFAFRKQSRRSGNTLVIEYGYQSLADFVPAERMAEYLQNLDKMNKCLGDGFVWR